MKSNRLLVLAVIAIFSVIFDNFVVSGHILLTDLIYGALSIYCLISNINLKLGSLGLKLILIIFCFFLLTVAHYIQFDNSFAFWSQLRFLFNFFVFFVLYSFFFYDSKSEALINSYLIFVKLCCWFLIAQVFLFLVFKINIYLTFGSHNLLLISNEGATYFNLKMIRVGGFFREPSWFAIFVAPSFYLFWKKNNVKSLYLLVIATILSTSGLGYLIMTEFFAYLLCKSSTNKKIVSTLLVIFMIVLLIYFVFPEVFHRLLFSFKTGGSSGIRIVDPFKLALDNISFFGVNPYYIKNKEGLVFVNSIVYLFLTFGAVGLSMFTVVLYRLCARNPYLFGSLMTSLLVDGCMGRIDFWITLLVCSFIAVEIKSSAFCRQNSMIGRPYTFIRSQYNG